MESMAEQGRSSRRIFVAIDESTGSFNALQWALNYLLTSQDIIVLIHVERPAITYFAGGRQIGFKVPLELPVEVYSMLEYYIRMSTDTILAKATELCEAKNGRNLNLWREVYIGDARQVLCDAANTQNPDMLVLGSQGYGGFNRVVLGSVSEYCVHHVKCPVVVVKPR